MSWRLPWPTGRAEEILQRAVLLVLSVAFAGLVGLAIVAFVSSQEAAKRALETRDQTAAAATRRIDQLRGEIDDLQADLEVATNERAELIAKVDALVAQIAELGGRPVVASAPSRESTRRVDPASPTTTPAPQREPSRPADPEGSPPEPSPQPAPPPDPGSPAAPCLLELPLLGCVTPTTRSAT